MTTSWKSVQEALTAEHAAIWAYGEIGATVTADLRPAVGVVDQAHRARRATVEALLVAAGQVPVESEPGYQLPAAVTDPTTAIGLAAEIEDGLAAAWRFVLGESDDTDVRALATAVLSECAVQALRWRQTIGPVTSVPAFPGLA